MGLCTVKRTVMIHCNSAVNRTRPIQGGDRVATGWRRCIGWLKLQVSMCVYMYRVAKMHRMPDLYKSFSAKEPHKLWLFCGKWLIRMRHPMHLRHSVHIYTHRNGSHHPSPPHCHTTSLFILKRQMMMYGLICSSISKMMYRFKCCSVLQCVTVCCRVLQCVVVVCCRVWCIDSSLPSSIDCIPEWNPKW